MRMQDQTITLTFKKLMDFSDLPKDWGVTTISFDWDFQPLLLIEEGKPPRPDNPNNHDALMAWLNAEPKAHHVLCWSGTKQSQITFEDSRRIVTAHVQRYEDGWLLGDARGGYAAVHDRFGKKTGKIFDLGDGSEDLQTTPIGNIWVSYFDEGVFGLGIGNAGLICFDSTGKSVFKYSDLVETHQAPYIADCYALNVISDHEVWLCYYADFPLVCLRRFELQLPPKKLGPTRSFAISNGAAICSRAYVTGELFKQSLAGDQNRIPVRPVDELGQTIPPPFTAAARGSRMCLRTDTSIYLSLEGTATGADF
jgi:hypothetical protein